MVESEINDAVRFNFHTLKTGENRNLDEKRGARTCSACSAIDECNTVNATAIPSVVVCDGRAAPICARTKWEQKKIKIRKLSRTCRLRRKTRWQRTNDWRKTCGKKSKSVFVFSVFLVDSFLNTHQKRRQNEKKNRFANEGILRLS